MPYSQNINLISDAVNNPIGSKYNLPNATPPNLWNDASTFREVSQPLHGVEDAFNPLNRNARLIFRYILGDILNTFQGQRRPNNSHYASLLITCDLASS